jgi:hypothetical protein
MTMAKFWHETVLEIMHGKFLIGNKNSAERLFGELILNNIGKNQIFLFLTKRLRLAI